MKPLGSLSITVLAVILGIIVAGANYYVRTDLREAVERRETLHLERLVASHSGQIEQLLTGVETALQALASQIAEAHHSDREIHLMLRQAVEALGVVRMIGVTDATGEVVFSSRSHPAGSFNLRERDYVEFFLDGGTDARFLSGPAKNLVDGQWQLALSLPVRADGGTLSGVIGAIIDPERLIAAVAKGAPETDFLTLLYKDFRLVARHPPAEGVVGTSLAAAEIHRHLAASAGGASSGVYTNYLSGEARIGAARRIYHDRLVFSSSRPRAVAMQFWSIFEGLLAAGSALLVALVASLAWIAHRQVAAERKHGQELDRLNRRLSEETEKVRRLAALDGLTGLANRRLFDEVLHREWRRGRRAGTPLALLMVDIDHFKLYNDRYGHQKGDACLKTVARALAGAARRPSDLVARYGGEEFAVILSDTDAKTARFLAERVRNAVRKLALPHESSPVAPVVTLSIGVASLVPTAGTDSAVLVAAADRALYAGKAAGRDRVTVDAETPAEATA